MKKRTTMIMLSKLKKALYIQKNVPSVCLHVLKIYSNVIKSITIVRVSVGTIC